MSSATREIQIDAAHRVPDHESKCFAIHGHRYRILATVEGDLVKEGSEKGMVVDFGTLKTVMFNAIHTPCDHGLILAFDDPILEKLFIITSSSLAEDYKKWRDGDKKKNFTFLDMTGSGFKIHLTDSPPTAENLSRIWFNETRRWLKIAKKDPEQLSQVEVFETPNCSAVYTKEEFSART